MANRKTTQFANLGGAQTSSMIMPVVDPSLGSVAAANLKSTLNDLFADLALNTSDSAVSMTGLLAAPSVSAATKVKWYYHRGIGQFLFSRSGGSYYAFAPMNSAAPMVAGNLPYVATGGVLAATSSPGATINSAGEIGAPTVTITQAVAATQQDLLIIKNAATTFVWSLEIQANDNISVYDAVSNKFVTTFAAGSVPYLQMLATAGINFAGIGAVGATSMGLAKNSTTTIEINSGQTIAAGGAARDLLLRNLKAGIASSLSGTLVLANSGSAFTTTLQAGVNLTASRTYTWPIDFGVAGSVLTDAAGDGTLSWSTAAGITGTIAATQIAYGSGANAIAGSANLTWDNANMSLGIGGTSTINPLYILYPQPSVKIKTSGSETYYSALRLENNTSEQAVFAKNGNNASSFMANGSVYATVISSSNRNVEIATNGTMRMIIDSAGLVGINTTASASAQLQIIASSSSTIGQIIKGAASQSADLQEWQNSSGTVLAGITKDGYIQALVAGSAATPAIALASADLGFYLQNTSISVIVATIGGVSSGTGFFNSGMVLGNNKIIKWSTNANPSSGTYELGLYDNAPGVLEINNGTAGTYRDLLARYGRFGGATAAGVVTAGGASTGGAYVAAYTSSQVANDAAFLGTFGGSAITGLLYGVTIAGSATQGMFNTLLNSENATSTAHCVSRYTVGGGSAGDAYIRVSVSGVTDWSFGLDNSDSDKFKIGPNVDPSTGTAAISITTANVITVSSDFIITGKQKNLTVSTGAGSAALGANCPAATPTAPFEWINVTLSDGSAGYVPAWK